MKRAERKAERKRMETERKRMERREKAIAFKNTTIKCAKATGVVAGAAVVSLNVAAAYANRTSNTEVAEHSHTHSKSHVMKADDQFVVNDVVDTTEEKTQLEDTIVEESKETVASTMMTVTRGENTDVDPFESIVAELHEEAMEQTSVEVESTTTKEEVTKEETSTKEEVTKEETSTKVETEISDENITVDNTADTTVTITDEETVENTEDNSKEETSTESTEEDHEDQVLSGSCSKEDEEGHDIHTCIEGLELVEGDIDRLTRTVIATTIDGKEAMTILKGQGVVPGESRGNEQMSILATNAHQAEVQLVVREDALEALQKEHTSDCTHCIPDWAVGRFGELYARAPRGAYFYPNACNDLGAIPLNEGQLIKVSEGTDRINGKLKASLDGGLTWGYVDSLGLELDVRNSELNNLTTDQAVERETTKEIVAKGFAFESYKSITIPACSDVEVYEETANGSDVAIGYAESVWLISVADAISAGLLQ